MKRRRYEVSGTDDFGDVHIFRTDNRSRAEEVEALMRDRLEEVEMIGHVRESAPAIRL